jgi:hypothetical protein
MTALLSLLGGNLITETAKYPFDYAELRKSGLNEEAGKIGR